MTFLFFFGKVKQNVSLVDLAEIDPYIEILPKFYTRILSSCVIASNTFFKMPELYFTFYFF